MKNVKVIPVVNRTEITPVVAQPSVPVIPKEQVIVSQPVAPVIPKEVKVTRKSGGYM